jgi:hypothetical protein
MEVNCKFLNFRVKIEKSLKLGVKTEFFFKKKNNNKIKGIEK